MGARGFKYKAKGELQDGHAGGYRFERSALSLECANGGLAPSCTECVSCDVAMQIKKACEELRSASEAVAP